MFLHIGIILAVVCAVKPSVILSLDEGGKYEAYQSVESCDYKACDQLCRRLGFPGGACVGDNCKCDNFKPNGDIASIYADCESGGCMNPICEERCIAAGSTGGAWEGDRCKCDNQAPPEKFGPLSTSNQDEENHIDKEIEFSFNSLDESDTKSARTCVLYNCINACRLLGYFGGYCVATRCTCY